MRANDIDARRRGEADLDRDRVVALHLLGGQARRLRRDFQDHWRRIGIGLDVEPGKCERAGANKCEQTQQDQRTSGQAEREKPLEQRLPPNSSLCRRSTKNLAPDSRPQLTGMVDTF